MEIVLLILFVFFIGFVIGATRERFLNNKKYTELELASKLWEMARYAPVKELRDNYQNNYTEWKRMVNNFKDKLLNN